MALSCQVSMAMVAAIAATDIQGDAQVMIMIPDLIQGCDAGEPFLVLELLIGS